MCNFYFSLCVMLCEVYMLDCFFFFFFKQKTAYEMRISDWSSDVCSSDLGQLVLIDTGCSIDGYHSDITRTYAFGAVDAEIRDMWDLEKEAQAAAFDAVQPGAPCESVEIGRAHV